MFCWVWFFWPVDSSQKPDLSSACLIRFVPGDAFGCGDASAAWHIRVLPATLSFVVYPNPTRSSFTAQTTIAGTLTIYTAESKELQQNILLEGANIIKLPSDLASGIYLCKFVGSDGGEVNLKLVYEP